MGLKRPLNSNEPLSANDSAFNEPLKSKGPLNAYEWAFGASADVKNVQRLSVTTTQLFSESIRLIMT